jgi:hypothetical protein
MKLNASAYRPRRRRRKVWDHLAPSRDGEAPQVIPKAHVPDAQAAPRPAGEECHRECHPALRIQDSWPSAVLPTIPYPKWLGGRAPPSTVIPAARRHGNGDRVHDTAGFVVASGGLASRPTSPGTRGVRSTARRPGCWLATATATRRRGAELLFTARGTIPQLQTLICCAAGRAWQALIVDLAIVHVSAGSATRLPLGPAKRRRRVRGTW